QDANIAAVARRRSDRIAEPISVYGVLKIGVDMKRRDFLGVLGGAVGAAWPVAIYGQEADRKYRLGLLVPAPRQSPAIVAFFDEMRANGFAEGQNLIVSFGGFDVRNEQISEGVKAVIASSPDAI